MCVEQLLETICVRRFAFGIEDRLRWVWAFRGGMDPCRERESENPAQQKNPEQHWASRTKGCRACQTRITATMQPEAGSDIVGTTRYYRVFVFRVFVLVQADVIAHKRLRFEKGR